MRGTGSTRYKRGIGWWIGMVVAMVCLARPVHAAGGEHAEAEGDGEWHPLEWIKTLGYYPFGPPGARTSRISDESVPVVDPDAVPDRPWRLEAGDRFVGTGNIKRGWALPGGAVLQPSVLVSGLYRTSVQSFDSGNVVYSEWANRLDIFANIKLTNATERIVVGMRPLDDNFATASPLTGQFTGYGFRPDHQADSDSINHFNADITTLFFEGELAEMIPNADFRDETALDVHVIVGRQPLFYQEGILIFDTMDAVGITKNQIRFPFGQNLQLSFLYAWDEINRGDNVESDDADLFLWSAVADFTRTTVNFDVVYVSDDGSINLPGRPDADGFYSGLSFVQRIGKFQTAFRAVMSHALDDRVPKGMGPSSAVDDGVVLFAEASFTPAWTENLMYATLFWGIDNYTPAARTSGAAGPMGRAGINFAGPGMGRFGAPVSNYAQDAVGGAVGYQWWFDHDFRKNLVAEIGWRKDTNDTSTGAGGLSFRYQQAFGEHVLLQLDAHGSIAEGRDEGWGSRVELRYAF